MKIFLICYTLERWAGDGITNTPGPVTAVTWALGRCRGVTVVLSTGGITIADTVEVDLLAAAAAPAAAAEAAATRFASDSVKGWGSCSMFGIGTF